MAGREGGQAGFRVSNVAVGDGGVGAEDTVSLLFCSGTVPSSCVRR